MISAPTIPLSAAIVAQHIDHTLLKPEATAADVTALIAEAVELGTYSVCVSPSMLPLRIPAGADLKVAVVCGFPSGKHHSAIKAAEAALSIEQGADEVDMVIDIGAVKAGRFSEVQADIAAVRASVPAPKVLKVIIESAALTDAEIVGACQASVAAGADFVKTSTGFHPAGGATVHAVRLMKQTVGDRAEVKASGGVHSFEEAAALIEAGATRLGVSGSAALLSGATHAESAGGY
ncbi:deoxyribose-phosphate aldolase [Cryobacterium sp. TmT2-59]|uniref:Deoxyribose-phosphate aldolase n=1 Tax=Cryobacterium shii TaxID=1259235 RepID=A0AAQ2C5J8_9MICO|nr:MULTISPECIES: deoxyribose-phosphate aldolase [Cryobacterium]TFC44702.1 deoxyribose-phosphate aldolase [Cryobacterium shii]TFC85119.1 deoxyribose-phosphate aldolase [Cryobacterium sp. TmT2-59]TFD11732.1 deoxyribose-phosphate aldolase [Cryobacterium sp. TMT4-10]TFD26117.1 deoxyribose-phosphate aldolase [Cryobacterium sp. TMT2-23]